MGIFKKIGDFIGDIVGGTIKTFIGKPVRWLFGDKAGDWVDKNWKWIAFAAATYLTAGAVAGLGAGANGGFSWLAGLDKVNSFVGIQTAWGGNTTATTMSTFAGPATTGPATQASAPAIAGVRPELAVSNAAPAAAAPPVAPGGGGLLAGSGSGGGASSSASQALSAGTSTAPASQSVTAAAAADPVASALKWQAGAQLGGAALQGVGNYMAATDAAEEQAKAEEEARARMAYAPMRYGLLDPATPPQVRPKTIDDLIAARSNSRYA